MKNLDIKKTEVVIRWANKEERGKMFKGYWRVFFCNDKIFGVWDSSYTGAPMNGVHDETGNGNGSYPGGMVACKILDRISLNQKFVTTLEREPRLACLAIGFGDGEKIFPDNYDKNIPAVGEIVNRNHRTTIN